MGITMPSVNHLSGSCVAEIICLIIEIFTYMKLRDVDIIISGTKTGDTYYAKSYPCSDMDKNSK